MNKQPRKKIQETKEEPACSVGRYKKRIKKNKKVEWTEKEFRDLIDLI